MVKERKFMTNKEKELLKEFMKPDHNLFDREVFDLKKVHTLKPEPFQLQKLPDYYHDLIKEQEGFIDSLQPPERRSLWCKIVQFVRGDYS